MRVSDVRAEVPRPHLRIRVEAAKGGRPRNVRLWWDAATLEDVAAWTTVRLDLGPDADGAFVASLRPGRIGTRPSRHTRHKRFRTACKVLGRERFASLTVHHDRRSYISHALAGGKTLAEARDAAGHTNVSITSTYLHVAVDDGDTPGNLFRFA